MRTQILKFDNLLDFLDLFIDAIIVYDDPERGETFTNSHLDFINYLPRTKLHARMHYCVIHEGKITVHPAMLEDRRKEE